MKTFNQIQNNDCGIAIMQSLIDHFYHEKIPYTEIFMKSKITQKGVSLVDFENLGATFGLNIESYACEWKEFLNLKSKTYYIILKNNENFFHYCIIYKQKNCNIVYDPNDKTRFVNDKELSKIFSGFVLTVEKKWKKFNRNSSSDNKTIMDETSLLKVIFKKNFKQIMLASLLSTIVIALTLINSQLFKFILSDVIGTNQLQNLSTIYIFFILTILLEIFLFFNLKYVQENINWKIYENLQLFINQKLINSKSFFTKIDENVTLQIPSCIHSISKYVTYAITDSINEILFILILTFVLPLISIYFLVTFGLIILLNFIIDFVCYLWGQKNKNNFQKTADGEIKIWRKFIAYLENENDFQRKKIISSNWENNFSDQYKIYQKINFFNNTISSTKKLIQTIINLLNLVIGSILIVNLSKISLEQLISGTFIIGFFLNFCGGVGKFVFGFQSYRIQALRFLNYYYLEEKHQTGKMVWPQEIHQLELNNLSWHDFNLNHWQKHQYLINNDTIIYGQNGIGKTTWCKTITNKLTPDSGEILLNKCNIYDYKDFADNVILLNSKSPLDEEIYTKIIEQLTKLDKEQAQVVINFLYTNNLIQQTDINSLSSGQIQIMNWVYLLTLKNKLIICDEALNFVQQQLKHECIKLIKPMIIQNNFLVVIEHDKSIKELFQHEIQLHKI